MLAPLPPHVFQILLALADGDRHGLEIMQDVLDRTGGHMRLWPGMLYRNLRRLEAEGLISEARRQGPSAPGSPRYFHLTAAGRRACAAEARRLEALVEHARSKKVLGRTGI